MVQIILTSWYNSSWHFSHSNDYQIKPSLKDWKWRTAEVADVGNGGIRSRPFGWCQRLLRVQWCNHWILMKDDRTATASIGCLLPPTSCTQLPSPYYTITLTVPNILKIQQLWPEGLYSSNDVHQIDDSGHFYRSWQCQRLCASRAWAPHVELYLCGYQ
jgi:hypothetical protein